MASTWDTKQISGTLLDFSEKPPLITGQCYHDLLPLSCSMRCSASIVLGSFISLSQNEHIFRIKVNIVISNPYQILSSIYSIIK